jgi:putative zinc finger protein
MNEMMNTPACERGSDLIAFLYGEASEQEAQDFAKHLERCRDCQSEMAAFGHVRASIGVWKEEVLAGFVSPQVIAPVRQKSALAALREFFNLSPLWMKGAVGFAGVLFCVMAVLVVARIGKQTPVVATTDAKYSEQQKNEFVANALRKQEEEFAAAAALKDRVGNEQTASMPKTAMQETKLNKPSQQAKVRRPLSKSEREQLAADLRLLSTHDEDSLNLLGDRINQEF